MVDYGFHAVFQHTDGDLLDRLQDLISMGVPTGKIYLTYDGRLTEYQILRVLERARSAGLMATFHAENDAIVTFLRESSGPRAS